MCYSTQTLSIAADLITTRSTDSPMMEALEGLPCRTGMLDAPLQFLTALLPPPVLDPKAAPPSLPSTPAVMVSPLVSAFLTALSSADSALLDLSPTGAICLPQVLGRMTATAEGVAMLSERATVKRLVGLLAPHHISSLLVWPINSGGNRKGVTDLVNAVCWALTHSFTVCEQAMRDRSRVDAEAKLLVCPHPTWVPGVCWSAHTACEGC